MLRKGTYGIKTNYNLGRLLSRVRIPDEPILNNLRAGYILAYETYHYGQILEIVFYAGDSPCLELRSSRMADSLNVKHIEARLKLQRLPSEALAFKLALMEGVVKLIRHLPHPVSEEEYRQLLIEDVLEDLRIEKLEQQEDEED